MQSREGWRCVAPWAANTHAGSEFGAPGETPAPPSVSPIRGLGLGVVLAAERRRLGSTFVPGFLQDRRDLGVGDEVLPALLVPVEEHPDPVVLIGIAKDGRTPWTRAAFASQRLWLRRFSRSGRNPRPLSLPGSTLSSSMRSVVALLRHSPSSIALVVVGVAPSPPRELRVFGVRPARTKTGAPCQMAWES